MPETDNPLVLEEALESLDAVKRQSAQVIAKLNFDTRKLNKENSTLQREIEAAKEAKAGLESEISRLKSEKAVLENEIGAQKETLKSNLKSFSCQQEEVGAKAAARVKAAEDAEGKARAVEQEYQKARSDHLSKVTETHDKSVELLGKVSELLSLLKVGESASEGTNTEESPA